jgi:hypothetical protein
MKIELGMLRICSGGGSVSGAGKLVGGRKQMAGGREQGAMHKRVERRSA